MEETLVRNLKLLELLSKLLRLLTSKLVRIQLMFLLKLLIILDQEKILPELVKEEMLRDKLLMFLLSED